MQKAIAVFDDKIKGTVVFTSDKSNQNIVKIDINLSGLKKNGIHGFHVHQYGDLSDGCMSMCAHFNPNGCSHGGPHSKERHVGDLGNIYADDKGFCRQTIIDKIIKLHGKKTNIIGRGLIIHEDADDLGQGNNSESLITGNAGKRIACAVIGYAKP